MNEEHNEAHMIIENEEYHLTQFSFAGFQFDKEL